MFILGRMSFSCHLSWLFSGLCAIRLEFSLMLGSTSFCISDFCKELCSKMYLKQLDATMATMSQVLETAAAGGSR